MDDVGVTATEGLSVRIACRVVGVSESAYYPSRERPLSARAVRDAWLTDRIRNRPRRHSSLGMVTPFEFEARQRVTATRIVA